MNRPIAPRLARAISGRLAINTLLILLAAFPAGCGTLVSKGEMRQIGQPFSGTQLDAGVISCLWEAIRSPETKPRVLGNVAYLFVVWGPTGDLPLSFVADFLFLPVDLAFGGNALEETILSTPAILPICGTGSLAPGDPVARQPG